jgi:hypothetical protein
MPTQNKSANVFPHWRSKKPAGYYFIPVPKFIFIAAFGISLIMFTVSDM